MAGKSTEAASPADLLAQVPPPAALMLRDYIKGLEAEAGNARSETLAVRRALESDVQRLRLYVAGLRTELSQTIEAGDLSRQELAAALTELAGVRAELAVLAGHRERAGQ